MKKLFILLLVCMTSVTYSQSDTNIVERDLRKFSQTVKKDSEEIKKSGSELVELVKKDYKEKGMKNFIKEYKYIIIMIFIMVSLSLLWLRNRKI